MKASRSLVFIAALILGCPAESPPEKPAPSSDTEDTAGLSDVTDDTAGPDNGADSGELDDAASDALETDVDTPDSTDVAEPPKPLPPLFSSFVPDPPANPVPAGKTSCPVIAATTCVNGGLQTCALWDKAGDDWATSVAPMTEQAWYFDRFYDLYHQMNGQASDVDFTQPVLAGTAEAEWSKPEYFQRYDGIGDASGWTGTALWAAAARYSVTGTPADYQRMVERLGHMALLYEIMFVPGQLARSHFAMLPEGAPYPVGHWGKAISPHREMDGSGGHFGFPVPDELLDRVPDYYTQGVEIGGQTYPTLPRVQADASRDMYVRSLPGILLAYDLLADAGAEEDRLRDVLKAELPCTLNRLKRGRIINLQKNTEILTALTTYFAGTSLTLDPDDMDIGSLDELVFFVMEQPHPKYMDQFDVACPDGPQLEEDPEWVFDAASPTFLLDLIGLASAEQGGSEVPVAWSMHVTVRPSDLLFIMQWAMTAHYLTGNAAYAEFIAQLMDDVPVEGVMKLWGAFELPKYCAPHFAPSIAYPSLYNVLARVDKAQYADYWTLLSTVARTEGREKGDGKREDAFFGILYGRMVDEITDPTGADFVSAAVDALKTYGMNPDAKLEPDRKYPRNFVDFPDPTVPLESIAEGDPEWTVCEVPTSIMGIEVPPPKIDGIPVRSVDPLPLPKRIGGTMLWQMDPWMVKREYGGVGMDTQWPMLGMFTPYWIGRSDGHITEGADLILLWKDTAEPCTP